MKKRIIIFIIATVVISIFISLSFYLVLIKDQPWISTDDLSFELDIDGQQLSSNDCMNVTCILTNVGKYEITYMDPFSIRYYIYNGSEIVREFDTITVEWIPRDNSHLRTIGPGKSVTYDDEILSEEFVGLHSNHTYALQARFTSADCYRAWKPYWKGTIRSNFVNFTLEDDRYVPA